MNQGRSGIGPSAITELGYNYRMNELQAILIRVQLNHLSNTIALRTKLVERYHNNLNDVEKVQLLDIPKNTEPAFYSLSVLVNSSIRDSIRSKLLKEGIETSILYHPVHLQPVYKKRFGYKPGDLPLTEELSSRVITLPLHLHLDFDDIDLVCDKLAKTIQQI
ncbi:dTDP-3-amino-3,4,6-trideoxy-alpha-D-glucose transaminase [subsurface metagenome]